MSEIAPELRIVEETSIFRIDQDELLVTEVMRTEAFGVGIQGERGVDGSGLAAVEDDPNPTLGGDLEMNGYQIVGTLEKEGFVLDRGLI